jgi:hypothetical protein
MSKMPGLKYGPKGLAWPLLIAVVFAGLGASLLQLTRAASLNVHAEAETGGISGSAVIVDNTGGIGQ